MAFPFDRHRFNVITSAQHILQHEFAGVLAYTNAAAPGVSTVEDALDLALAVLYPQTKPSVANPAALPALGNTVNDYRVVLDDGDGNAAGYRWEQREGEASPSWHKIYDMDWGADSILAQFQLQTQDLYVYKKGNDDLDASGTPVAGTYAGQRIYGGSSANTNLTLNANSGDGVGGQTGFVQTDNHFRATSDNSIDLGTSSLKWRTIYLGTSALVSTMTISTGSITDSTGAISFDNENLSTTGTLGAGAATLASALINADISITAGSITSVSGAISFGNENLSTTGSVTGNTGVFGDVTIGTGSITASGGAIDFGNENLSTTGTLGAGNATVTRLDSDNIRIDGNTVSVLDVNGNLLLVANGTGIIDLQSDVQTLGQTVTGTVTVTGQHNIDNLRLDGNVISSQNLNGNITLTPNGTGSVEISSKLIPAADGTLDLGAIASRFNSLFLDNSISDGTDSITMATLLSLRDITVGIGLNQSIFWDGSKFVASAADTEIDHGSISGLADDDHTQYALLAGRASGQSLNGGTAASENLTLDSTAHATKGNILVKSNVCPFTNASYSGGWSGTDLGDATHYFRDIYTKGEARGLRIENFTTAGLPSPSGQNVGRLVFDTDVNKVYVDTGTTLIPAGVSKFISDTAWNGSDTTKDVTVSSTINDAREATWALHDNADDFDRIYCSIKAISATQVRITVSPALPAGSYRLIGLE